MVRLSILLALLSLSLEAQNAQLRGLISDPSGSSVPGASLTITNMATGVARSTASNEQGLYTLGPPPPPAST